MVEYVDLWLAGNYLGEGESKQAFVAAITQAGYVMWLLFTFFTLVAIGGTALTARFVGAGDYRQASRVTNQAIVLGTGLSIVVLVAGALLVRPFAELLQLRGDAADHLVRYLLIVLPVVPAIMLEEVGIACLRGAGDMISGLVAMTIVNVINVIVSYCLLLGWGPFPEMGWTGLAVGSAIARIIGAVIVFALLCRGRAGLRLRWADLKPDPDLMRRILRIGVPGGIDSLVIVACHMWYVSIINQLGTLATAAHGVGVRIEALGYMPGGAFQMAATTMAGQFLGAGDYRRATRSVIWASVLGIGIMSLAGALFFFASVPLAEFFLGGDESAVIAVAAQLLRIVAFTMPPLALTMVLTGALRGAGDTRWPLAFTLIGFLAVRIPLAYFWTRGTLTFFNWEIPAYQLGVAGAWYAMCADVSLRALLVTGRFAQGGWQRVKV